jgi:hypothetical protein
VFSVRDDKVAVGTKVKPPVFVYRASYTREFFSDPVGSVVYTTRVRDTIAAKVGFDGAKDGNNFLARVFDNHH